MSLEQELLSQRLRKIDEIAALGFRPYGQRFEFTHRIDQILSEYGEKSGDDLQSERVDVRVAGRILTVRRMGKASFLHLQQNGKKLQVYIRKGDLSDTDYSLFELLEAGDIIGVEGFLFRTRTGELTTHASRLEFLSKILLSLPEKWHGLEDVETRYRQRYLDLIANPEVRDVFVTRAKIIASLRRQLEARGFIEVETPMMQPIYGGAAARPFVTHHNTLDIDLYLRIAPELYLKRLVVGGLERVFEINRNFRNEGISTQHNPEFTMLEFYQAYTDYEGLMDFTEELLRQAAIDATGGTVVEYQGVHLDFGAIRRLTMREAVIEYWPDEAKPTLEQLSDLGWLRGHSSKPSVGEALGDIFERVAEHHLIQPTIIHEYPVELSPLSKQNAANPAMVDRFEIYAAGMELGNAYTELNDPREQRRRFDAQLEMQRQGDDEAHQMDEDFVRALCYGLPPTAGEGIGIDRLTMLFTNSRSIRDVILFPQLRPEGPIGIAAQLRELEG
ncbi:MAG: lysine--tRNA ligase [Bryobacterales bacterium]|nr:lysine--tRNA ligase [Bryobacterales bacterium]